MFEDTIHILGALVHLSQLAIAQFIVGTDLQLISMQNSVNQGRPSAGNSWGWYSHPIVTGCMRSTSAYLSQLLMAQVLSGVDLGLPSMHNSMNQGQIGRAYCREWYSILIVTVCMRSTSAYLSQVLIAWLHCDLGLISMHSSVKQGRTSAGNS